MNLLRDKRDMEKPAEEPIYAFPTDNGTPDSQVFGEESGFESKRAFLGKTGTILLSLATILVLAIVITYFGFYKNRKADVDSTANANIAAIDSTRDDMQSSSGADVSVDDIKQETAPLIKSASEISTLSIAADFMQKILAAMANGQLTTLFIDDGSFSAEIDAGSLADAKKAYTAIKESLPAIMAVTSSPPVSGTSALIAGTFTPPAASSGSGLSSGDIDAKLRTLAKKNNTSISSLDISKSNDQSFVFMKIEGTLDNCRLFIDNLSEEKFVNVSKLIMMPASAGNFSLVLRFYI